MPYEIATVFGDFQCSDPRKAFEALDRGRISSLFVKKANSYRCPSGRAYGQGWCLLSGKEVKELYPTNSYVFRMSLREQGNSKTQEEISLQKAYVLRSICLSNGYGDGKTPSELREEPRFFSPSVSDDNSLYLVEFVDERYFLAKFSSINKQYNIRNPAKQADNRDLAVNFYRDTLKYADGAAEDAGTVWTWKQMIEDIWGEMTLAGTLTVNLSQSTGTDDIPTKKPENFHFNGVTAWDALHHVLEQIGATLVFNPTNTTYTIETLRKRQSKLSDTKANETTRQRITTESGKASQTLNLKGLDARRVFDYEVNQFSTAILPEKFNVYFRRQERYQGTESDIDYQRTEAKSFSPNAVYLKQVSVTSVDLGSVDPWPTMHVITGTEEPVWHYEPAFFRPDGELLDNDEAEEDQRTYIVAHDLVKGIVFDRLADHCGKCIYSGIPSIVLPGIELETVVWRDYGDALGLVTEAMTTPGPTEAVPAVPNEWGWSASVSGWSGGISRGLTADLGGARFPSRENTQPINFGQHTYPIYPQPMQFVMIVSESSDDEETDPPGNPTPVADCGVGKVIGLSANTLPGVVVRLDPDTAANSGQYVWNVANSSNLNKPACRVVIPGLRKKPLLNASDYVGLLGQVFLCKLAGSDADGLPLFVADWKQDFIIGTLVDTLTDTGLATMTGLDGETYEVSGMFLPAGTSLPSTTLVGCHAHNYINSPSTSYEPYWVVIVSNACPG